MATNIYSLDYNRVITLLIKTSLFHPTLGIAKPNPIHVHVHSIDTYDISRIHYCNIDVFILILVSFIVNNLPLNHVVNL